MNAVHLYPSAVVGWRWRKGYFHSIIEIESNINFLFRCAYNINFQKEPNMLIEFMIQTNERRIVI